MKKGREVVNQIYTACRYIVEMSVNVVKESMWNMLRAQYAGLDVPMSVLLYIAQFAGLDVPCQYYYTYIRGAVTT